MIQQSVATQPAGIKPDNPRSLTEWAKLYYFLKVKTSALETQKAKLNDLSKFINFYHRYTQSDDIAKWIAPVTKAFQDDYRRQIFPSTGMPYKTTSINRVLKTVKHFAAWLITRRSLPDGNPTKDIPYLIEDEPDWKGLTDEEIMAIEKVCAERCKNHHVRRDPQLETALFYCLLHTGLRESELINLNCNQYHDGGFHQVARKNHRISTFVPLSKIADHHLSQYLGSRAINSSTPIFLSKSGDRLSARSTRRICASLSILSRKFLKSSNFSFSPHQLRHSFLKRMTDKHGVHYAHRVSGNISVREIFRYAKPSNAEIAACVDNLF